ncbi:MFS transporter [Paenibacillus sp. PK4536]|uniref:MFS transporter n=1 Tax=Paenibacillus sp. PK4536 TaxID=3024576 RepID=UPI002359AC85|nr:MFS transporter [Paenibacillus sp. PK4536]WIM39291.1 MFS transporter [Paenibacillus sp. PK4536]
MSTSTPHDSQHPEPQVNKHALRFGLISVFLCGIGFSIIAPVVPFLVQPYVHSSADQAIMVTLLMSVYALCVFLAAPVLGALSDKYGRRPILLLCLFGSAVGYLIFGIGGALWVLFVGRIIEGITGGSISTIFAYFADIIPPQQRTKYFGWLGAIVGVATVIGPTLGGILAKFDYTFPLYFGAVITLLNMLYGYFFMPESLAAQHRQSQMTFQKLNPFAQLASLLSTKYLSRLLIAAFLLWIPNGSLQAIFSQLTIDTFQWKPVLIGLMFSILGVQDIIAQGLIMPQLLKKYSDQQIATLGMMAEIIGYGLIAVSIGFTYYPLFIAGMFVFGCGDSLFGPAFNGMLSKSVDASEQGRVQGGSQSIQALARMIGPLIGGQIYILLGHTAPAWMGMILIVLAIFVLHRGVKNIQQKGFRT